VPESEESVFRAHFEVGHELSIRLSEASDIRPRKPQDADRQRTLRLPAQTILWLEQLRQQTGKRSIAEVVAEAFELYARIRTSSEFAPEQLSPRNREVLRLMADGLATKEIAARLKISVKTVEFHRAKLMKKLGVRGIAGLVRYAIRMGVILP
jgi:DNA-binding NarL/FixJ family response regulator